MKTHNRSDQFVTVSLCTILIAVCIVALAATGCGVASDPDSEGLASTPAARQAEGLRRLRPVVHCSPYRNVVGYWDLATELTNITNCAQYLCPEGKTSTVKTNYVLNDANNSPFIFSSTQTITTTKQSDVIAAARAWADSNPPAGYFVDTIAYSPNIIVSNGPTYAALTIKVTYSQCTGLPMD